MQNHFFFSNSAEDASSLNSKATPDFSCLIALADAAIKESPIIPVDTPENQKEPQKKFKTLPEEQKPYAKCQKQRGRRPRGNIPLDDINYYIEINLIGNKRLIYLNKSNSDIKEKSELFFISKKNMEKIESYFEKFMAYCNANKSIIFWENLRRYMVHILKYDEQPDTKSLYQVERCYKNTLTLEFSSKEHVKEFMEKMLTLFRKKMPEFEKKAVIFIADYSDVKRDPFQYKYWKNNSGNVFPALNSSNEIAANEAVFIFHSAVLISYLIKKSNEDELKEVGLKLSASP